MEDFEQRSLKILSHYLGRTQSVIDLLKAKDVDHALKVIRSRHAAFYSFRNLDQMALRAGLDLSQNPAIKALWCDISILDQQLEQLINDAKQDTESVLSRLGKVRRKISGYHSGNRDGGQFVRRA